MKVDNALVFGGHNKKLRDAVFAERRFDAEMVGDVAGKAVDLPHEERLNCAFVLAAEID